MKRVSIFSYKGVLSRGEFAKIVIPAMIINAILNVISKYNNDKSLVVALVLISFGLLSIIILACIKRLRDIKKSPWWTLVFLIPLGGFILILYLLFAKSKDLPLEAEVLQDKEEENQS